MKVGYVRVSGSHQNTVRQEVLMEHLGVNKLYIDVASGETANRLGLRDMLSYVREGDIVVVESISRFARNTKDLLDLIDTLERRGVSFVSLKEDIDTKTPSGRFMITVFGAVAQLERDYIKQRQREGIQEAKRAGKYKGRKPIQVDQQKFREVYRLWRSGDITAVTAQKRLGLSPNTFYRRVRKFEAEGRI